MLTIRHKTSSLPVPNTAKEDIPVYKLVKKNNKSMHQGFQYRPNKLFRLRKKLKPSITENDLKKALGYWGTITVEGEGFKSHFHKGFHSWHQLMENIMNVGAEYKLVRFIVPKGAKYYKGTSGDIISTSLRADSLKRIKVETIPEEDILVE